MTPKLGLDVDISCNTHSISDIEIKLYNVSVYSELDLGMFLLNCSNACIHFQHKSISIKLAFRKKGSVPHTISTGAIQLLSVIIWH
jgi:hypothetical protein